jgi:hypothetical protein
MKNYLATVAAVGLIAGVGAANAQSPGSMEKKEQPGATQSQPSQTSPSAPSTKKSDTPSTQSQAPSRGTVGQAPSSDAPKAGATTDSKSGMSSDTKSGTDTKSGLSSDTKSGADTKSGTSVQTEPKAGTAAPATTGQAASGSINLTAQQKTEIRTKVLASAPKVDKVNFSLNVGTVVPRTVHIVAVPETLVVIHPQWRGYRYFVVGDEIVIVEPDSLKIVAVLSV